MDNDMVLGLVLLLLLGVAIGGLLGWVIAKFKFSAQAVSKADLAERYVAREAYDALQVQADLQRADLAEKEDELKSLTGQMAAAAEKLRHLEQQLAQQQQEIAKQQAQAQVAFENIANRLLEEKSQKFTDHNQRQINDILTPLREKIKSFEEGIEKRFVEETRDRVSLKKEIEQLRELNQQLSTDAHNLTSALKGGNKTQGDWGELQLETLLEKAGLVKDIHYTAQGSYKDEEGRQKRPDFIINLPEGKHLVIDAKVSLTAYERFFNAADEPARKQYLKLHTDSLRGHIRDLRGKNYQHLYQINSPDYLLLFIPIEGAMTAAMQEDNRLFLDALDQHIVIVTSATLLATLRTVAYIWQQEKQKKSVLEIARQSGMLYDKFCAFVDDLKGIGQRLEQANGAYADAMNKLVDSKKFGDTLVGRAEKIRALGARNSKTLPSDLLDMGQEEGTEDET